MRRLVGVIVLLAVLFTATPASATYIPPDGVRHHGPAWEWGKCRHHDAPWGAGRDWCVVVGWR